MPPLKDLLFVLVVVILLHFLTSGMQNFMETAKGEYIRTDVVEKVVDSNVVTVKVGETFPINDGSDNYNVDDYLYQGIIKQPDGTSQIQIGKRLYHQGGRESSYEVQEMLIEIKAGEKIKEIKKVDEPFSYDVTLLGFKKNAIEIKIDKTERIEKEIRKKPSFNLLQKRSVKEYEDN